MRLLIICMVGVICSCGSNPQNSQSTQPYPQDRYMGLTSGNPNIPLNPSYHDQQTDMPMMRKVMSYFEEVAKVITSVQLGLSTNMPRYRVKVSV